MQSQYQPHALRPHNGSEFVLEQLALVHDRKVLVPPLPLDIPESLLKRRLEPQPVWVNERVYIPVQLRGQLGELKKHIFLCCHVLQLAYFVMPIQAWSINGWEGIFSHIAFFLDSDTMDAWVYNSRTHNISYGTQNKKYIQFNLTARDGKYRTILKHQIVAAVLLNAPVTFDQSMNVDHIDSTLVTEGRFVGVKSNKPSNLRYVATSVNLQGRHDAIEIQSRCPGVSWDRKAKRWISQPWIPKRLTGETKGHHLKTLRFRTETEAIADRNKRVAVYGITPFIE